MNAFIVSIPNEWERKKYAHSKWIWRIFFLCSNLSNDNIISANFGLVWKQVCKIFFLVWNWVRIWRTGRHTPTKNSKEYPPGFEFGYSTTPSGVRTFFASGGCCNKTRDNQEHILLTGFMKKNQRNVLNITVTKQHLKQVWFYIICGTTRPEYAGTNYHKSSDCFEYPQKTLL